MKGQEYSDDVRIAVQDNAELLEGQDLNEFAFFLENVADTILDVDTDVIREVAKALRDYEEGLL